MNDEYLDYSLSSSEELSYSADDDDFTLTREVRKADTNIVALNLGSLAEEGLTLFTGDPCFCVECNSVFSSISRLNQDNDQQLWVCEFCGRENDLFLEEEEIPTEDTIDFMLEPPTVVSQEVQDESIVVFCIDTSGSMCCTSEVESSQFKLKRKAQDNDFQQFMDGSDQYFPGQRRDVVYVSRLECVQAAVDSQLENFKISYPNRRVVIVDFNTEVTVHDRNKKHVIAGDRLNDKNYLNSVAESLNLDLSADVASEYESLSKCVFSLEEKGQTALGPALLVSTSIASLRPGSSVVLCTDGLANVGLGAFEEASEDEMDQIEEFYVTAANYAKIKGVTVSIISIEGTTVNLEYIAKVATITNGMNDIVNPLSLAKNFNSLLENPVIATNVSVKMLLHHGLTLYGEETVLNSFTSIREVGNANKETTISFEYGRAEDQDIGTVSSLPFQVQISYTRLDGARCIRVISKMQAVTEDRDLAEENINVAVVGIHTVQQTAKLTEEGNYTKARMKTLTNKRMVKNALKKRKGQLKDNEKHQYNAWMADTERMDEAILNAQQQEIAFGEDFDSCSDDDSQEEITLSKQTKKTERLKKRKMNRTNADSFSNVMYQQQKPKFSKYFY
eukprot:TRINITY_DN4786_c0_g1_i2.p1 TRINITY_DN4786_c0_g1~~TRINITY_DN4786_c0_g1_i2.p1  ORF type:complete len:618 (+),score=146.75 TRINITY_DN4786_c0_g1_i2:353-2206(+)